MALVMFLGRAVFEVIVSSRAEMAARCPKHSSLTTKIPRHPTLKVTTSTAHLSEALSRRWEKEKPLVHWN
jgi:hypothetical protein